MNVVIMMGRLTRDAEIRVSQSGTKTATYTLAVDRRSGGEKTADFIRCVAFGKNADFTEKYLSKGSKIIVRGNIKTGSYEKQDGTKVYTTDVWVDAQEFAESKAAAEENVAQQATTATQNVAQQATGFFEIVDSIDEELPFK